MPEPIKPGDLINAVTCWPIERVRDLLARGAEVNEKNNIGNTALIYAAMRQDYTDFARLLLDKGAAVDEKNIFGYTALILAAGEGNVEMVELLLDNNASPFEKSNDGYTALSKAEARGHSEVVRMQNHRSRLEAEKARIEASHALAAKRQERLKKAAPRFSPR